MNQPDRDRLREAAIIAHQIKAPVSTLKTLLRTVLGGFAGELNEKQKGFLESADVRCQEALDTIRGMLALSAAGSPVPADATTDVARAARAACQRHRDTAAAQGLDIRCEIEPTEAFVRARPEQLEEALSALVENAVRYTPPDGRAAMRVAVDPASNAVRVTVEDSGIGVPDEARENLFEPFFRARNAKKFVATGTGLGLAFVRAVVQAAGGRIDVATSGMGGAAFVAEMPRVASPDAAGRQEAREPSRRVVVVGGVAAGPKIASRVMRLDPEAHVTIVEKGRVLSYAGCGLPFYISGLVGDQRELVSTPEGVVRGPGFFETVKDVHVMNRTEVVQIDRDGHRVRVRDLISGHESWLPYDKLALTTGAVPIVPDIPGANLPNVFTLHGIEHAEGIKANLAEGRAKDVTIVGGGLIGVEMTESLVMAGCRVTLVEMRPHLLPMLDGEMSERVRSHFEAKGVRVQLGTRVTGFEGDGGVQRVITENGTFPADLVIMGVGVRPNVDLASAAGLELGETGAIKVDDQMRTSDPDILAAGDCVECVDVVSGRPVYVPLGSTAGRQGRVAAATICGEEATFPGVLGTTVCKVFDYTVARSGLTEARARELGYSIVTTLTAALDRAHFMPTAGMIVLKLVVDADSRRLLGIQAVGPGEAAKRVDVAVAAMTGGLTIDRIANLDLCYAPSYADAFDNLHTACHAAENKLAGRLTTISPQEVKDRREVGEKLLLLDVRTQTEFEESRIEGARHIPLGSLRGRLSEIPRDAEIVAFSRTSQGAYEASVILRACGFERVQVMDGGIVMWPYGLRGE